MFVHVCNLNLQKDKEGLNGTLNAYVAVDFGLRWHFCPCGWHL